LEKAIALDPRYAEALGLLSDSFRLMATFGVAPSATATLKAKQLAEQAIAIDPEQAEAWSTLACVEEQYEWNFPLAEAHWKRALALDPRHARARAQRALWAFFRGALAGVEARAEAKRAVDDDPLNSWVVSMHSYMLGLGGWPQESLLEAERAMTLDTDSFFSQWNLLRAHAAIGRNDDALALAPRILAESGRHQWVLGLLAWIYGKVGRLDAARAVHDEMEGRSRHEFISPFWLATAASAAGLSEEAVHLAERAVSEHDPLILWSRVTPFWATIREHPRFGCEAGLVEDRLRIPRFEVHDPGKPHRQIWTSRVVLDVAAFGPTFPSSPPLALASRTRGDVHASVSIARMSLACGKDDAFI
jgi:tetratricopeptide (TPR) repeat protein